MSQKTYLAIGIAAVLGSVVMMPSFAADDEVIYACANPAGQLRIIDAGEECRRQEQSLSWNIQGSAGPQGPEGPEGPPGTSFVVVDANDEEIGYLSVNYGPWLFILTDGGYTVTVNTRDGEIEEWSLYFLESDCKGQAYSKLYPGWIGRSGSDLYYSPFDASTYARREFNSGKRSGDCFNYDTPRSIYLEEAFPNDSFITGFDKVAADVPYALPLAVIK